MTSSLLSRAAIENETFLGFGTDRLRRLCRAVEMHDDEARVLGAFEWLSRPWNRWRIGPRPRWYPSILSDDHAPFELSATFSEGETEIQCYWEAQAEEPGMRSNARTGLSLLYEMAGRHDLPLARWKAIEDLFVPERPRGLFTILFGVTWGRGRAPRFKIYLNPRVHGLSAMHAVIQEAMARLGFRRGWDAACEQRLGQGSRLDEIMYLCLDLSRSPEARVKVYRRHFRATVADLAAFASVARDYQPGEAERFYGLVGEQSGPFTSKPLITSLTYREHDHERPCSVTLEFPISSYVGDDQAASERIARCFAGYGLDASRYRRAVDAIATRPLDRGNGIHAHITLRRVEGAPRLTVYFATEAYPVEALTWAAQPESVTCPPSVIAPASARNPASTKSPTSTKSPAATRSPASARNPASTRGPATVRSVERPSAEPPPPAPDSRQSPSAAQ